MQPMFNSVFTDLTAGAFVHDRVIQLALVVQERWVVPRPNASHMHLVFPVCKFSGVALLVVCAINFGDAFVAVILVGRVFH